MKRFHFLSLILFLLVFSSNCHAQNAKTNRGFDYKGSVDDITYLVENLEMDKSKAVVTIAVNSFGTINVISIEDDGTPPPQEIRICEGKGNIGFAKCVGNWLKDNPGKCLAVWHDDAGNHADTDCTVPGQ